MTTAPKTNPTLDTAAPETDAETTTTTVGDRAKSAASFVRDHPGAFIAGGVVLGVVLGALLPRRASKIARSSFGQKALALAATAGELGLAASRQARDAAEKGAHDAKDLIDRDSAIVREKAGQLVSVAREVSQKAADRASTLASRLKH